MVSSEKVICFTRRTLSLFTRSTGTIFSPAERYFRSLIKLWYHPMVGCGGDYDEVGMTVTHSAGLVAAPPPVDVVKVYGQAKRRIA